MKLEAIELKEGYTLKDVKEVKLFFNNYNTYFGWMYDKEHNFIGDFTDNNSVKISKFLEKECGLKYFE